MENTRASWPEPFLLGPRLGRPPSPWLIDFGKHSALYDFSNGKVTLIDFEAVVDLILPEQAIVSLNPELISIFRVARIPPFIYCG